METLLVVGVDGVVGANLAATLCERFRVVGLTSQRKTTIAGCETRHCPDDSGAIRNWVAALRPRWIVYCGPAAEPSWDVPEVRLAQPQAVETARQWARSASDYSCRLTVISSDAVFTGPWMFHGEESESYCPSAPAEAVRRMEAAVAEACPHAMIARTHAFGWSPASTAPGTVERLLSALEAGTPLDLDCARHATPILATDLARLLESAYERGLEGLWHVAGAERVNPVQFAERLADVFELPAPRPFPAITLMERPTGFGRGETSLQTKRLRRALGTPLPMLGEGLSRLQQQAENGDRDRINPQPLPLHEKVA